MVILNNTGERMKQEIFVPIHKHLLLNTISLSPIIDPELGKEFLLNLVAEIHMIPVTEPQCVNVEDPGNEGLTGSINLATSHITFHNWTRNGLLMLDVYSCCDFDVNKTIEFIDANWELDQSKTSYIILDRETMQSELFI